MTDVPSDLIPTLVRDYERLLTYLADLLRSKCESPIEIALGVALGHIELTTGSIAFCFKSFDELEGSSFQGTWARLLPQQKIGPYRVDFLLVMREQNPKLDRMIVIECDGHDWHERTREQASKDKARDRYFAQRGILVMRFTGSEIWRDAIGCARQVHDTVKNIAAGWKEEKATRLSLVANGGDD